jgi:hypothetical protein
MYTEINFKTKKQLKEAVIQGEEIRVYQPNDVFDSPQAKSNYSGRAAVEGPHYPEAHRWYASVEIKNGLVVKVK